AAGQAHPSVSEAEGVGRARPEPALVVVGEELGLVGRHVDLHRAFPLARLAGEAEVERLLDLPVAPAAPERIPFQHLEEQAGPAAGRVLLLPGHPVARAHGAGVLLPAVAHPYAALGGAGEAPLVVPRELEVGVEARRACRVMTGPEAQVLVQPVGV